MPNTIRSLRLAILGLLERSGKAHKINMIGRPYEQGDLERYLKVRFDPTERRLASMAFEQLRAESLIYPTFSDVGDPEAWVEITDQGRDALKRGDLDELDSALMKISRHLIEIRAGAWSAVGSSSPDALRQASHSARELLDQTIKLGALDSEIRAMPDFKPDVTSRNGITRRQRLRYLIKRHRGEESDAELTIADKACDLVIAADDRLTALAHSRSSPRVQEVRDSLHVAEIALRRILIGKAPGDVGSK